MKDIKSFPQLKTERLFLRELSHEDWKMISYLRSDPEVNKYIKRPNADSEKKALSFINKIKSGFAHGSMLYWVITEVPSSSMIGSICLWHFSDDGQKAEVGYDLDPKFHGQGIMDEALKAILRYAFNILNLYMIEAYTSRRNIASAKLLERNGFSVLIDRKDEANPDNVIFEVRKD